MPQTGSVTNWLQQLKGGVEGDVQQQIWNRYFEQLVDLARGRMARDLCRVEDEEDAVLSAFASFFVRVKDGQFPRLDDRTSLWPLLVTITLCKTRDLHRRHRAQKRDARRTIPATVDEHDLNWLEQLAENSATPEIAVQAAEEAQRLIDALKKESLQSVARLKLEGYTNAEIAVREGVMERSVERRLALIRQIWTELAEAEESQVL